MHRFPASLAAASMFVVACTAAPSGGDDEPATQVDDEDDDDESDDDDETFDAGRGTGGGGGGGRGGAGGSAGSGGQGGTGDATMDMPTLDGAVEAPDGGARLDDARPMPNLNLKPAIIGAGYGAVRVVSFDQGKTWTNRVVNDPRGGDDTNLIRAIGWGNGVWVAAGWKLFISRDGKTWREISDSAVPGGWYDCVNYKDGRFIVKTIRADRGGQSGPAIVSSDDGQTWKQADGATNCYTQNAFQLPGVQLRSQWPRTVQRSENGGPWQNVYEDACCNVFNFATGMAEP